MAVERVLVLSAGQYDFTPEGGEDRLRGVTLWYVDPEPERGNPNRVGCMPLKSPMVAETWRDLGDVPGVYDVDFRMRPGQGNRPTLTATKLTFVAAVDLVQVLELVESPRANGKAS